MPTAFENTRHARFSRDGLSLTMRRFLHVRAFVALVLSLLASALSHGAKLEVVRMAGTTLRDNPLGDPASRWVAMFVPDDIRSDRPLPLVIFLPGWGGSSDGEIAENKNSFLDRAVDDLAKANHPVRIAVIDGRSRYGGSQFINSTATGRYADYVVQEIAPALRERYAVTQGPLSCVLAGHSSGAYGALVLGMEYHDRFGAVVALSPDSDFELTHKPLVSQPRVKAVTKADLDAAMAKQQAKMPADDLAQLVMGLCANYAPIAGQPGRFEWLYNDQGEWRPEAWQRWLDLDPLTLVKKKPDAFASQRVYLDGAEHDEFGANIGARKIFDVLRPRKVAVAFYESPGHHSDRLAERLVRGLTWVLR